MDNHRKNEVLNAKHTLNNALKVAIKKALIDMGDDVHGIDWFSSYADQYNEMKEQKAA